MKKKTTRKISKKRRVVKKKRSSRKKSKKHRVVKKRSSRKKTKKVIMRGGKCEHLIIPCIQDTMPERKKNYRGQTMKVHPDKAPNCDKEFRILGLMCDAKNNYAPSEEIGLYDNYFLKTHLENDRIKLFVTKYIPETGKEPKIESLMLDDFNIMKQNLKPYNLKPNDVGIKKQHIKPPTIKETRAQTETEARAQEQTQTQAESEAEALAQEQARARAQAEAEARAQAESEAEALAADYPPTPAPADYLPTPAPRPASTFKKTIKEQEELLPILTMEEFNSKFDDITSQRNIYFIVIKKKPIKYTGDNITIYLIDDTGKIKKKELKLQKFTTPQLENMLNYISREIRNFMNNNNYNFQKFKPY